MGKSKRKGRCITMFKIIIQYLSIKHGIRKAKQKGYVGKHFSIIYPINVKRLENSGYKVYEPNLFHSYWIVRWVD